VINYLIFDFFQNNGFGHQGTPRHTNINSIEYIIFSANFSALSTVMFFNRRARKAGAKIIELMIINIFASMI